MKSKTRSKRGGQEWKAGRDFGLRPRKGTDSVRKAVDIEQHGTWQELQLLPLAECHRYVHLLSPVGW